MIGEHSEQGGFSLLRAVHRAHGDRSQRPHEIMNDALVAQNRCCRRPGGIGPGPVGNPTQERTCPPQRPAAKPKASGKGGSPERFVPSEQVRADFDVSFPIDI